MSALRKAGVWLGLIEDDDDRGYGYDERSYDEDYPDDEVEDSASVVRARVADRLAEARNGRADAARASAERHSGERPSGDRHSGERHVADYSEERHVSDRGLTPVRQIARQTPMETSQRSHGGDAVTYPTRDSLALAPEPADAPQPEPEPRTAVAPRPSSAVMDERRYQITTLHPATFNEARTIGEHFRDGVPVILNLTEMAEADAKRLVDFAAGLAFGLRGTMERVTNRVFLLSPANIQVTAEDKAKIAEGGFFRQ
jgi:cell division inhibitor SepF